VQTDKTVLHQEVVGSHPDTLTALLLHLARTFAIQTVLIGNGTHSEAITHAARSALPHLTPVLVPEAYTSERARKRYLQAHRSKGLARLVPLGLRSPNVPYDDYVAVILAEDYLHRSTETVSQKETPVAFEQPGFPQGG
jgi:hypothetical protein